MYTHIYIDMIYIYIYMYIYMHTYMYIYVWRRPHASKPACDSPPYYSSSPCVVRARKVDTRLPE